MKTIPVRRSQALDRRTFFRTALAGAAGAAVAPELARASEAGVASRADHLLEAARELPLRNDADVIVCGAGPAGCAAALAAARAGARTRLFELHGCLGGVWTAGLLTYIFDFDKPGLARELARIDLPLSLYTEWYWQIDLHNLFRFLQLRLDPHAQLEIREYARALLDMARLVAPAATASFENHILGGSRFSGEEMAELRRRLATRNAPPAGEAGGAEAAELKGKKLERFEEKLRSGRQL